jgi:hypothetical protein
LDTFVDHDVEETRKAREIQAVTAILQQLKAHPQTLGSVLKQVPGLLASTISTQEGILKYCMVQNPMIVKQFLKLESNPSAMNAWHDTVEAFRSKGIFIIYIY